MNVSPVDDYLPTLSLASYLRWMQRQFPQFYASIQFEGKDTHTVIKQMIRASTDFEGEKKGGRGDLYRKAQQNISVRLTGISQVLKLATGNLDPKKLPHNYKILDVLGGDGIIARAFISLQGKNKFSLPILTSDIAADMINQALQYKLPAIRQPAQHLFLKTGSFDAVIIAYGTHHIPKTDRLTVCREAFRVLKSSGRIVIHDFEKKSPISRWFSQVVDPYSKTGHKYLHFTVKEVWSYLKNSGFENIQILHMYDPFIVSGSNKENVFAKLMDYILNMYGLEKLLSSGQNIIAVRQKVYQLIKKYIIYDYTAVKEAKPQWKKTITFYEQHDRFIGEMPRVALVGIGQKPL